MVEFVRMESIMIIELCIIVNQQDLEDAFTKKHKCSGKLCNGKNIVKVD